MDNTFLIVAILVSVVQFGRYLIMAGLAYYYFWVRNRAVNEPLKLQKQPYKQAQLLREIGNSFSFSVISGFAFALPFWEPIAKYSKLYTDPAEHSLVWLVLSVPVLIVLQDTYFYWMHRALHSPALFRFHKVHHESRDPSPFTAYSFHWTESLFEIAWFVPLTFIVPLHQGALFIFGTIALLLNINGHLGIEIYPESWKTHPVMQWMNSSTAHNNHHKYFKGNYGFFFNFWDRVMKTATEIPAGKSTAKAA